MQISSYGANCVINDVFGEVYEHSTDHTNIDRGRTAKTKTTTTALILKSDVLLLLKTFCPLEYHLE